MRRQALVVGMLLALLAIACADDSESSSDSSAPVTPTRVVTPLPDPGSWRVPDGTDIGTIERAWQVGTATRLTPYVEAAISNTTGRAFFIFTASRQEIGISLSPSRGEGSIDAVHLYQHTEAGLGDQLASSRTGRTGGKWELNPGTTYVLEIFGPDGTFF